MSPPTKKMTGLRRPENQYSDCQSGVSKTKATAHPIRHPTTVHGNSSGDFRRNHAFTQRNGEILVVTACFFEPHIAMGSAVRRIPTAAAAAASAGEITGWRFPHCPNRRG